MQETEICVQLAFSLEELFDRLSDRYPNTRSKVIDLDTNVLGLFFEEFKRSNIPLILRADGFSILFNNERLFLLDSTKAVQHNAYSVIRDLFKILYDGKVELHRKDIEQRIHFQH